MWKLHFWNYCHISQGPMCGPELGYHCLLYKVMIFLSKFTWASCQIRKIAGCACVGNAGNVFTATDFKWNQRVFQNLKKMSCIVALFYVSGKRAMAINYFEYSFRNQTISPDIIVLRELIFPVGYACCRIRDCIMMTPWHGNAFCITGPLWGESITPNSNVEFFLAVIMNKFWKKLSSYQWIWDVMKLKCRHCIVLHSNSDVWMSLNTDKIVRQVLFLLPDFLHTSHKEIHRSSSDSIWQWKNVLICPTDAQLVLRQNTYLDKLSVFYFTSDCLCLALTCHFRFVVDN